MTIKLPRHLREVLYRLRVLILLNIVSVVGIVIALGVAYFIGSSALRSQSNELTSIRHEMVTPEDVQKIVTNANKKLLGELLRNPDQVRVQQQANKVAKHLGTAPYAVETMAAAEMAVLVAPVAEGTAQIALTPERLLTKFVEGMATGLGEETAKSSMELIKGLAKSMVDAVIPSTAPNEAPLTKSQAQAILRRTRGSSPILAG